MAAWIAIATLSVILIPALVYPAFAKIRRRSHSPRSDGLQIISDPVDAKFEIVAVHGLGAHSEYTWMGDSSATSETLDSYRPGKIHLLRDLLKADFTEARILSFAYNCDWLIDAPVKTVQQIGETLHDALVQHQSNRPNIPRIFIGHSFGGIVIKMALCKPGDHTEELVDRTCGIVFLGTPHHGSSSSIAGYVVARLTEFLGSNPEMLLTLMSHQKELSDLEERFIECMKQKEDRRNKTEIISFCETKPTYMLGWLSLGIIVPRNSARGSHAARAIPIDTDHSGLNKCSGRDTQLYRELQKQLQRLRPTTKPSLSGNQRAVLEKLNGLDGAAFDSHENEHNAMCLDGTRRELLGQIAQWTDAVDYERIYWLQGMAGTGKSTIARTVARDLASVNRLAGSFFFKRGEGDRGSARRFFTTLAAQIVLLLPEIAGRVRNALEADPGIVNKSLGDQFEKLILEPITATRRNHSTPLTIVIDALDECEGDGDIKTIIYQFSRMNDKQKTTIKFFVTSRFEPPIRLGFEDIHGQYIEFPLHTIPKGEIRRDIEAFLQHRLQAIRHQHNMKPNWPSPTQFQKLLDMAIPLFIFAATACRMVEDHRRGGGAEKRLNKILQYQAQEQLDSTYLPALNQMVFSLSTRERNDAIKEFKSIVGSIMTLARPLSVESLARLLPGVDLDCVCDRLDSLHSVLDIPSNTAIPDTHDFWIDKREAHKMLASRCLQVLSSGYLKRDICGLEEPGKARDEISPATVERFLPSEVQYACLNWVYHLKEGVGEVKDNDQAHTFLGCHFLHWLEALSLMGRERESIVIIYELQSLLPHTRETKVSAFLEDAERFILYFLPIMESAPLQLYYSGLLLSPINSIIRQTFQKYAPNCVVRDSWPNLDWSPCRQTLTGHTDPVHTVAFSMDGRQILSGSSDHTIRIWNASTGACIQTLKGHAGNVHCATFAAKDQRVFSGADDYTMRIWDVETGSCLKIYEHEERLMRPIESSTDGQWIASASDNGIVKVWDANTAACIQTLETINSVTLMAFSDNEKQLISVEWNGIIKRWDVDTGVCSQTWDFYGELSNEHNLFNEGTCALSTDRRLVAFHFPDEGVKIWNMNTGTCVPMHEGDGPLKICRLAFSPDDQRVIGSDYSGIMMIWDVATGKHLETLRVGPGCIYSIAFSPDGQRIACGNRNGNVTIWNATPRGQVNVPLPPLPPIGANQIFERIEFSPDGKWVTAVLKGIEENLRTTFSTDGRWIAYSYDDTPLAIMDTHTYTHWQPLSDGEYDFGVAFSADSRRVAFKQYMDTIEVWDVLGALAFGNSKITVATNCRIKIWDVDTGTCLKTLEHGATAIHSATLSVDNQWLAASLQMPRSAWHYRVQIWNFDTGACAQIIRMPNSIYKMAFDPTTNSRLIINQDIINLRLTSNNNQVQPAEFHSKGSSRSASQSLLKLEGQWILHNDKKFVWLPSDYKRNDYRGQKSQVFGNKMVIGCGLDRVLIVELL
ncbi:Vegetative incompatibility HET-E-1-like protein [Cladobotryum mycophilum]|uniref:Mitochondrial division protein 1 n=1 Tax=Cladobotryum mycophilum TaxID=491253 RepID=A0ABR0SPR0_9HYPO